MGVEQRRTKRIGLDRPADAGARHIGRWIGRRKAERLVGRRPHIERRIVIEAEPVDRPHDPREIAVLQERLDRGRERGRIGAETLRIGKCVVPVGIDQRRRGSVRRHGWQARLAAVNAADRRRRHRRTQCVDGGAMGQVHVVNGRVQRSVIAETRRMLAAAVAEQREHRRLVEGRKPFDPVAVPLACDSGIVREPCGAVARRPAAEIVERLRQVPMIKTEPRLDARREQCIDQAVIECEAFFVRRTLAERQHPRPRHRKAISADTEIAHQRDVFRIAVIVVAGDVAGLAVVDMAGARKRIPDAGAAAVLVRRAFDLIGRGRNTPDETGACCWPHDVDLRTTVSP